MCYNIIRGYENGQENMRNVSWIFPQPFSMVLLLGGGLMVKEFLTLKSREQFKSEE